jgi:putative SbcD/Mre11-related phosphoesterase
MLVRVNPLIPYPALFIEGYKDKNGKLKSYIAITDLHIGSEWDLDTKGITIDPTILTNEMVNLLSKLTVDNNADGIIILGDLKSSINSINKRDWEHVPSFLRRLSAFTEVYLVPGNHDANIGLLTPSVVNIMSTFGMVLDDTLLTHGHTLPTNQRRQIKRIVMGHIHPVFFKKDSIINGKRVWLYIKVNKDAIFPDSFGVLDIIIVPSFNKYFYSMNKNRYYRKSISPIIKKVVKRDAFLDGMAITLEGSIVGGLDVVKSIL